MRRAHENTPKIDFAMPKGVLKYDTVRLSGLLATNDSGDTVSGNLFATKLEEVDKGSREIQFDGLCG